MDRDATTASTQLPLATKRTADQFTCNKKAFYPTVAGGTGMRTLYLPSPMCPDVYDADDMLEALCCANTHVKVQKLEFDIILKAHIVVLTTTTSLLL